MAEQTKLWYLRHFDFFEGMDEAAMEHINRISTMSTVPTHQPILFPDRPSKNIFLLKKGHVKISRIDEDGREMILEIIGPGELFGELALLDEKDDLNEMAVALEDVLICAIRIVDFEDLLRSNPELNLRIIKRIGFRLRKFEERVTDLIFKDTRKRIAGFLLKASNDFGKVKQGQIHIRMHLSHQEIGLLTGAARQTVTTMLNELRSAGIIDFSRKEILIKDLPRLKALAS